MKIAVIGAAGSVGSAAVFNIAIHSLADEIVMIGGRRQNVLKQHSMDLNTAVAAKDILVRAGSYEDIPGSKIVIIAADASSTADGSPRVLSSRMELLPGNLALFRDIGEKIRHFCFSDTDSRYFNRTKNQETRFQIH